MPPEPDPFPEFVADTLLDPALLAESLAIKRMPASLALDAAVRKNTTSKICLIIVLFRNVKSCFYFNGALVTIQ